MTREEAIHQIEEFMVIDDWSLVYMPQLHNALDLAIKALEEQERQHRSYNFNSKSVFELMREGDAE